MTNIFDADDELPVEPQEPMTAAVPAADLNPMMDMLTAARQPRAIRGVADLIKQEVGFGDPPAGDPSNFLYGVSIADAVAAHQNRRPTTFETLGVPQIGRALGQGTAAAGDSVSAGAREPSFTPEIKDRDFDNSFARQAARARSRQTPGEPQDGRAAIGEAVAGVGESLRSYGEELEEASPLPKIPSYTDVKSIGDAGTFVWESVQQMAGSVIPFMAGGVVAGVPGAVLVGWQMGAGQMRREVREEHERLLFEAMQAERMGLAKASTNLKAAAARFDPAAQAQVINASGMVIGLLDSVVPASIFAKMPGGKDLKKLVARHVVKQLSMHAANGSIKEGITEVLQETVQIATMAKVGGAASATEYLNQITSQSERLINAGLVGAIGGGAFGGVAGAKAVLEDRRQIDRNLMQDAIEGAKQNVFDQDDKAPEAETDPTAEASPAPQTVADIERVAADLDTQEQAAAARLAELEAASPIDAATEAIADPVETTVAEAQTALSEPDAAAAALQDPAVVEQVTEAIEQTGRPVDELTVAEAVEIAQEAAAEPATDQSAEITSLREELAAIQTQRAKIQADLEEAKAYGQRIDKYIAEGNAASPRAVADAFGVSRQRAAAILDDAATRGTIKKVDQRYERADVLKGETPRAAEIRQELTSLAREMAPILPPGTKLKSFAELADIAPQYRSGLADRDGRVVDQAGGNEVDAFQVDDVIYLSRAALNRGRVSHEALHALVKAGVVSEAEIALLAERARKVGVFTPSMDARYRAAYADRANLEAAIQEEAAAHLIEARMNGRDFGRKINAIIDRILEAIERIANAFRGRGYQSVNDVVEAFLGGDVARRVEVHPAELIGPIGRYQAEGEAVGQPMMAIADEGKPRDPNAPSLDAQGEGVQSRLEVQYRAAVTSLSTVEDFLDEANIPYKKTSSQNISATFGPSLSTYYMVEAADGPRKIRVSDHDYVSPENGLDIRINVDSKSETKAKILRLVGREVPDAITNEIAREQSAISDYRKSQKDLAKNRERAEEDALLEPFGVAHIKGKDRKALLTAIKGVEQKVRLGWPRDGVEKSRDDLVRGMLRKFPPPNIMFAIADRDTGQSMRRSIDELGYYSAALEAAKSWPQKKGTPEQALMWLKKSGAKDSEIEATGLKALLEGKASVTRDELVQHLEQNRVRLNEVRAEGQPMFAFAGERAQTADLDALARAKDMAEAGATREAIWQDTGWFRGVDGKWRWEQDETARMNMTPEERRRIPPWESYDVPESDQIVRDQVMFALANDREPRMRKPEDIADKFIAAANKYLEHRFNWDQRAGGLADFDDALFDVGLTESDGFNKSFMLEQAIDPAIIKKAGKIEFVEIGEAPDWLLDNVKINELDMPPWLSSNDLRITLFDYMPDDPTESIIGLEIENIKDVEARYKSGVLDVTKAQTVEDVYELPSHNARAAAFESWLDENKIEYGKGRFNDVASAYFYVEIADDTVVKVRFADHLNQSIMHERADFNIVSDKTYRNTGAKEFKAAIDAISRALDQGSQGSPPLNQVMFALSQDMEPVTPGLDMSREARMERAKAMGFDTDTVYYHGTNFDFDEFIPGGGTYGEGIYLTKDRKLAGEFAENWRGFPPSGKTKTGPSVKPLLVRGKIASESEFDAAVEVHWSGDVSYSDASSSAMKDLQNKGFSGAVHGMGDILVFDPTNIRSVNAAFDPARSDSPNLMFAFANDNQTDQAPRLSELKSLQSIMTNLVRSTGIVMRQGLSRTAMGRQAKRAGLQAVYNPMTGVVRVQSMSNIKAASGAIAAALSHRFGSIMDQAVAKSVDDLTLTTPPNTQAPQFPATGYTGLALSETMKARVRDAVVALARASMLNERGDLEAARKAQNEADDLVRAIRKRLGDSVGSAVIKDVMGGIRSITADDTRNLLTVGDLNDFDTRAKIRGRLDGMPNLPPAVKAHILAGTTAQDMRQRARAVALEALDANVIRASLQTFLQSQKTAGDLSRMLNAVGLSDRADLMGDGSLQSQRDTVNYVRTLIRQIELQSFLPAVVPSILDVALFNPNAKTITDRIEQRFGGEVVEDEVAPTKGERDVAFQSWLANYILNSETAFNQAPDFFRDFEAILDANDKVLLAKLQEAQQAVMALDAADPGWRLQTLVQPATRRDWLETIKEEINQYGLKGALSIRANQLYNNRIDKGSGIVSAVWELLQNIEQQTGQRVDLRAIDNPVKLNRLGPHSNAWATRDIEKGVRKFDSLEHEGPGLIDGIVKALGTGRLKAMDTGPDSIYRKFSSYLVTRYAAREWERFRDGAKERPPLAPLAGGDPTAEMTYLLKERVRMEQEFPAFAEAAEMIYEYQRNLLKLQRDEGLISAESYDTLIQDEDYVPFYRVFGEEENASSGGLGGQGAGAVLKRKRGSDRDVIDPIASIAQKTFETRSLIATNNVKRSLMALAEKAGPAGGMIAERIDAKQLSMQGINVQQLLDSAAREQGLDAADKTLMMDLAQTLLGNDAVASYYTNRTITPGRKPITFFWENGELQAMQLGDGDRGHRLSAMMMDNLNTFGKVHFDTVVKIAQVPAQAVRAGVVTHLEFALANIIRDGLMAFLYDPRAKPIVTQIQGLVDVLRDAPYVQQFYATGGMLGGEATDAFNKFMVDRNTDALVQRGYRFRMFESLEEATEAMMQGLKGSVSGGALVASAAIGGAAGSVAGPFGAIAGIIAGAGAGSMAANRLGMTRSPANDAVGVTVGAVAGGALGGLPGAIVGGAIGGAIGGRTLVKFGEISETATRARLWKHAYDRAKENGLDDVAAGQEAAFWSHDYTDYSRHGSKMQGLNAIIPFLNANLQGNDLYLRRLLGKGDQGYNPGFLYPLFRMGFMQQRYDQMTTQQKQELADSAWTWAMTIFGLGSISATLAFLFQDDERIKNADSYMRSNHWLIPAGDTVIRAPKPFQTVWFSQLIERAISEAGQQDSRWLEHYREDLWSTWAPPMIPTAIDLGGVALGMDFNRGRTIIPDYVVRQDLAAEDQYLPYTSDFSRWVGEQTKTSPLYVETAVHKFGASWARTFTSMNFPGLPWYNPDRPTRGPEEEFITRRFLWRVGAGSEAGETLREMMGSDNPLQAIWSRMRQPVTKLAVSARTYRNMVESARPDQAGAIEYLQELDPKQRAYAVLEGHFRGRNEAKFRKLHPANRADEIASITYSMGRQIVDEGLESGRPGSKSNPLKPVDLTANQKRFALDALAQFRMMETHNTLVLLEEPGFRDRKLFNTAPLLRELKEAVPAAYAELMKRFENEYVMPFDAIRAQWPEVKSRLEDDAWIERIRKDQTNGASGMFGLPWARAQAAKRSGGFHEPVIVPQPARRTAQ